MIYFLVEKIICLAPFGFVQLAPWRPDTMDAGYPVIRWHQVANRAGNRYILIFFIYRAKGCNKKFFSGPGVSSWPLKKTFFEALKKMPTKMWPIRSKEGGGVKPLFCGFPKLFIKLRCSKTNKIIFDSSFIMATCFTQVCIRVRIKPKYPEPQPFQKLT